MNLSFSLKVVLKISLGPYPWKLLSCSLLVKKLIIKLHNYNSKCIFVLNYINGNYKLKFHK